MADNSRFQTKTITIPSGTAAGSDERSFDLDRAYANAKGVCVFVNKDGGLPGSTFQFGLRDDTNTIVEKTNAKFFQAGVDCAKSQRMTPVDIAITGRVNTIMLTWPATLTTDLVIDVVFELVK